MIKCPHCDNPLELSALQVEVEDATDQANTDQISWVGVITKLGIEAGKLDKRKISDVTWSDLPITLYAQTENSSGHSDAFICGSINDIWVDGTNVYGKGYFSNSKEGQDALLLVQEGALRGLSVDIRDGDLEIVENQDTGEVSIDWVTAKIGAATLVAMPAFEGAEIQVLDGKNLKASVGPHKYPKAMFSRIKFDKAQRIDISDDGEISGHIVQWGIAHRGFSNKTVVLYPAKSKLRDFNIGRANFIEGGTTSAGILTSDGLHAPEDLPGANTNHKRAMAVQAFVTSEESRFEDVRCQFAQVFAWEDEFGIAIHGSLLPDVTVAQATRALAGCSSIDYRNDLFMGAHFVNTCGYLPPALDDEEEQDLSKRLVASAYGEKSETCKDCTDAVIEDKRPARIIDTSEIARQQKDLEQADFRMKKAELSYILAKNKKSS
jgi:hypothetical protein